MSSYEVKGCEGVVSKAIVYGLNESIARAKYPMAVNIENLNGDLSPGIIALAKSGTGEAHDQFLTGITVQFDLTFSNKAWVEAERYRFLYFVSSQSTIHRMAKFNLETSYNEYVDKRIITLMQDILAEYNAETDEKKKKELYLKLLYSNPAGFKITAGMTTNYRQLKTIYKQRKNHKLPEWRAFCKWMETLPLSEFITGAE